MLLDTFAMLPKHLLGVALLEASSFWLASIVAFSSFLLLLRGSLRDGCLALDRGIMKVGNEIKKKKKKET